MATLAMLSTLQDVMCPYFEPISYFQNQKKQIQNILHVKYAINVYKSVPHKVSTKPMMGLYEAKMAALVALYIPYTQKPNVPAIFATFNKLVSLERWI
jgi:hypothetical protein